MGYFSNGSEGMAYFEEWCANCVHDMEFQNLGGGSGCFIWASHLLENPANQPDHWLHKLIPRSKDGLSNKKCVMFCTGKGVSEEKMCLCGQKTWEADGVCRVCKMLSDVRGGR